MIRIVHLSDLHFRKNWDEEQELVLKELFKDLSKQVAQHPNLLTYLVFSGDFVLSGGEKELYQHFFDRFDGELSRLGIPKAQRICVPGNHDVSKQIIESKYLEHEGVINQISNETEFNDYIGSENNLFNEKFKNYMTFQSDFSEIGIGIDAIGGQGHSISENIGIYCLNTAVCTSAGYKNISDKGRLLIDTRNLQKWIASCQLETKILVMHHPIDWLSDWAKSELRKILRNSFSLCLNGHAHEQSTYHMFNQGYDLIDCSAPPLLSTKRGELGYSIITVRDIGVMEIQYRQWTRNYKFVTGVNFSDTDDGKVVVKRSDNGDSLSNKDEVSFSLDLKLKEALRSFSSQPIVWVEPLISNTTEIGQRLDDKNKVPIKDILEGTNSVIIKAPPQFGLTCLSHFLIKEAWQSYSAHWVYIDANLTRSHTVESHLKRELEARKISLKDVQCVVLDSWTNYETDSFKMLRRLCEIIKDTRLIIMQTIDDNRFLIEPQKETIEREFDVLHLLALSRNHIRKVVSKYNDEKHIGDENAVLQKVVSDLDILNIHRTPYNCLTLLKVAEKYFDESPVNRTKMLEKVLFLLFDIEEIPTYKSKPDLTDCEYVLGFFSEKLIKEGRYSFSREEFLKDLRSFCSTKLIDLEVDFVFDILYRNNILFKRESQYVFKSSYWLFYFAAQRMHHSDEFSEYMLENKRYVAFPEIIEFYTGIDRRRNNALKILHQDLREVCDTVYKKVGLPDGMDPYKLAKWEPSPESIERMKSLIGESVINSGLPDSVKDKYADRSYNPIKPYDQSINRIFYEYSLHVLIQTLKSTSRALRNSDFADPEIKRDLLKEVLRGWEQISKVLFALTPNLATEGQATFEGQSFILMGNFGDTMEERINRILQAIPNNVASIFKEDLFSNKIGPLLFDQVNNEASELKKLELITRTVYLIGLSRFLQTVPVT
jgi:predicted MPP superfamily phosphohydrolase